MVQEEINNAFSQYHANEELYLTKLKVYGHVFHNITPLQSPKSMEKSLDSKDLGVGASGRVIDPTQQPQAPQNLQGGDVTNASDYVTMDYGRHCSQKILHTLVDAKVHVVQPQNSTIEVQGEESSKSQQEVTIDVLSKEQKPKFDEYVIINTNFIATYTNNDGQTQFHIDNKKQVYFIMAQPQNEQ